MARSAPRALAVPGRGRVDPTLVIINAVLMVGAVAMVLPFAWMVLSSLKSNAEIVALPPTILPERWHWQNYVAAWNRQPFARYYLNSFIVASVGTLSSLLFASMAGFVWGTSAAGLGS